MENGFAEVQKCWSKFKQREDILKKWKNGFAEVRKGWSEFKNEEVISIL